MTVTIPASPEFPMAGMKQQLTTRILECAKGGFVVIFEGHGVAARSTWDEVLDAIETEGGSILNVSRMKMPRFTERGEDPPEVDERPRIDMKGIMHSLAMTITAATAAILSALVTLVSVKIA